MKHIDLSYINEVAMGNQAIRKELADLFVSQVADFNINFDKLYEAKDWSNLGKEAHKAKTSILILGLNDLSEVLQDLQHLAEKGEKTETYPKYISMFKEHCKAAIQELKEEIL